MVAVLQRQLTYEVPCCLHFLDHCATYGRVLWLLYCLWCHMQSLYISHSISKTTYPMYLQELIGCCWTMINWKWFSSVWEKRKSNY